MDVEPRNDGLDLRARRCKLRGGFHALVRGAARFRASLNPAHGHHGVATLESLLKLHEIERLANEFETEGSRAPPSRGGPGRNSPDTHFSSTEMGCKARHRHFHCDGRCALLPHISGGV